MNDDDLMAELIEEARKADKAYDEIPESPANHERASRLWINRANARARLAAQFTELSPEAALKRAIELASDY